MSFWAIDVAEVNEPNVFTPKIFQQELKRVEGRVKRRHCALDKLWCGVVEIVVSAFALSSCAFADEVHEQHIGLHPRDGVQDPAPGDGEVPRGLDARVPEHGLARHLEGREYILDGYSIADIACLPWFKMFSFRYPNQAPYPNLEAWMERLFERDAVQRGFLLDIDKVKPVVTGAEPVTDEVRRHLFASYQRDDGPTG